MSSGSYQGTPRAQPRKTVEVAVLPALTGGATNLPVLWGGQPHADPGLPQSKSSQQVPWQWVCMGGDRAPTPSALRFQESGYLSGAL